MKLVSVRLLGLIVIWAALYHTAVGLTVQVLQPEFSPIRTPGSAHVLGAYGSWMTTTYFVLSLALVAAADGLVRTLNPTRLTRAAFFVFVIAAAATCLAGVFPIDWPPPIRSISGRLHAIGGSIAFPTYTAGVFLFSLSFRHNAHWRRVSVVAMALSGGLIATAILAICSMLILGFAGYLQRVFFILLVAWMIVIGRRLTRAPTETAGEAAAG